MTFRTVSSNLIGSCPPPSRPYEVSFHRQPYLRAILYAQRFSELGTAVVVERNRILGAGYRQTYCRDIDGVGAEALPIAHDPRSCHALGGLSGADTCGQDMPIGETGKG